MSQLAMIGDVFADMLVPETCKPLFDAMHSAICRSMTEYEYPDDQNVTKEEAADDMYSVLSDLERILNNISYE